MAHGINGNFLRDQAIVADFNTVDKTLRLDFKVSFILATRSLLILHLDSTFGTAWEMKKPKGVYTYNLFRVLTKPAIPSINDLLWFFVICIQILKDRNNRRVALL